MEECPICYEIIGDKNSIITDCNHKFHASCIMTNVARNGFSCPCCRSVMAEEKERDDDTVVEDDASLSHSEYSDEHSDEHSDLSDDDSSVSGSDTATELDEDYDRIPTHSEVVSRLKDRRVTYEQLVAYILHYKEGYEENRYLEIIYDQVFMKFVYAIHGRRRYGDDEEEESRGEEDSRDGEEDSQGEDSQDGRQESQDGDNQEENRDDEESQDDEVVWLRTTWNLSEPKEPIDEDNLWDIACENLEVFADGL